MGAGEGKKRRVQGEGGVGARTEGAQGKGNGSADGGRNAVGQRGFGRAYFLKK